MSMILNNRNKGSIGYIVIIILIIIGLVGFYIWDNKQTIFDPYSKLRSGVWRLTQFDEVYESGTYFGSHVTRIYFNFYRDRIKLFEYSGKTDSDGIVSHLDLIKGSEDTLRIIDIKQQKNDWTEIVLTCGPQNLQYKFLKQKGNIYYDMYVGQIYLGKLYEDDTFSAYPDQL